MTPTWFLFHRPNGTCIQLPVTGKLSTKEWELAQSLAINLPRHVVQMDCLWSWVSYTRRESGTVWGSICITGLSEDLWTEDEFQNPPKPSLTSVDIRAGWRDCEGRDSPYSSEVWNITSCFYADNLTTCKMSHYKKKKRKEKTEKKEEKKENPHQLSVLRSCTILSLKSTISSFSFICNVRKNSTVFEFGFLLHMNHY